MSIILVVDTSIVFSALVKPGKIRGLIFDPSLRLYAPVELREELEYLEDKLLEHTSLTFQELKYVENVLMEDIVEIVPRNTYSDLIDLAIDVLRGIDENDAPFVALSMFLDAPLWTGDKKVIRVGLTTGRFRAVDTRGVEMLLEGREWNDVLWRLKKSYLSPGPSSST